MSSHGDAMINEISAYLFVRILTAHAAARAILAPLHASPELACSYFLLDRSLSLPLLKTSFLYSLTNGLTRTSATFASYSVILTTSHI